MGGFLSFCELYLSHLHNVHRWDCVQRLHFESGLQTKKKKEKEREGKVKRRKTRKRRRSRENKQGERRRKGGRRRESKEGTRRPCGSGAGTRGRLGRLAGWFTVMTRPISHYQGNLALWIHRSPHALPLPENRTSSFPRGSSPNHRT